MLFVPLLGDFHVESAVLASFVGCLWAGIRGSRPNRAVDSGDFFEALQIAGYLYLAGLPLLLNALFTGCFSIDGLAFWILYPLPGVYFGYATGRLFRHWRVPYAASLTTLILFAVAFGVLLFELLNYPQVYFFNHVWGGWPGPIYDEIVRVDGSAVFFRLLTLLWTVLLWQVPSLTEDRFSMWIVALSAIALAFGYTQLAEFGVISPRSHLQQQLGGHKTTDHFELYYDRELYSSYEIERLAEEHEFYYGQISERLNLPERDSTNRIESYLYGHPWQKKRLVGAKFTSYVPIWLEQDQLHIARQQIAGSLKHELVHVLAKQFGNNLFNGSWSIGLVEGVAVAIAGGPSPTSTIDQMVVSEKPYPDAEALRRAFSLRGFYGGRSGVNYTTSGSFVQFLMRNYPVTTLKEAYRKGSIAKAYDESWDELANGWHRHLDTVEVDSVDRRVASRIFGIPSLFEQECPHVVSGFAAHWDRYRQQMAARDTSGAIRHLNKALAESDSSEPVKAEWSYRQLIAGKGAKVREAASLQDTTVDLQLLYADAFAMAGDTITAVHHLEKGKELFTENPDSLLEPALRTRLNEEQWQLYRAMTYRNRLPDSLAFSKAVYRTKIRSLRKALDNRHFALAEMYAGVLASEPLDLRYFEDYRRLIHHLAFREERELARAFIERLNATDLRARYRQLLEAEREWLLYLADSK